MTLLDKHWERLQQKADLARERDRQITKQPSPEIPNLGGRCLKLTSPSPMTAEQHFIALFTLRKDVFQSSNRTVGEGNYKSSVMWCGGHLINHDNSTL